MDLQQLRYFIAVAETGSFTAAAERAFVTQPTLSAGLARLERELGARLFERGRRGAWLTAQGERFMPHAQAALRAAAAGRAALKPSAPAQRLRLGVLRSAPPWVAADLLTRLAAAELQVEASEGNAAELERWLSQERIDAALTSECVAGRGRTPLLRDRLVLVLPAGHALSRKPQLRPEDLHEAELVVRTHCDWLTAARRALAAKGVRPRIVARTDRDDWALRLVRAGLGCCLVPDSLEMADLPCATVRGLEFSRTLAVEHRAEAPPALATALAGFDRLGFAH